jgi:hypothetical protein
MSVEAAPQSSTPNLRTAHLAGIRLQGDNLGCAQPEESYLARAEISDSIADGTAFTGADLSKTTFRNLCYDESTTWPTGFTPPPNGDRKKCEKALRTG